MPESAKLSNEEIVQRVLQKIKEKDEVILAQQIQLEEKDQDLKKRDDMIQELQERINELESSARAREELMTQLSAVLD